MMNKMVVANLVHRPIRSMISIVAIALEVTLILLIVGLCYGIMNDSKNRTAGIGADVIVQPPGSSFLAGISGAPVPVKVADVIRKMPHVKVVDSMSILNHPFRICGVVENGRGARKFVPMSTLQDLLGAANKASVFYVKLDDPGNAEQVVNAVKAQPGMEAYSVLSTQAYLSM